MSLRLLKSTATVGSMTLVSRVLGLTRDVVVARFGAGPATDAFFVAFKIPNFLRRLFGEGAFSQAFVPVLAEYKSQRSLDEVRILTDRVAAALGGILFLVTLVGILAAPVLVYLFAPGFHNDPAQFRLTEHLLRITFPYILFISLTALAGGILNTYGRFGVPAITPVLLNLCLIGAALWLAPHMAQPITALAWGVLVAGVVQLAFQFPFLARLGLLPRPQWRWRDPGVQRILRLMLPALFGVSVTQINLLVDTLIASFLASGSITWLYYSDRLMEFPVGVFGVALGTVILPSLSQRHAESDPAAFRRTLDWGLRWVLLVAAPATLGLILLAGPLLTTLFQYKDFTAYDVVMASHSLITFSVGLTGFILIKILAPGFYARQNTATPVRIAAVAVVANIVFNLLLVLPLQHAGVALATSLAAYVNSALLFRALRRDGIYAPEPGWIRFALQVGGACLVMGLVLGYGRGDLASWLSWGAGRRAAHLLLWVVAGGASYLGALVILGLRPAQLLAHHE
ncbi:MAG: murein biosynthesis integral membrane protein MurJ [Chromatiales bacterium 21-64-14]|nr:MAG: murein biosynthesis integral membrane protein MurJ [Chromatiales bacterium 21-64-14]HQU16858.1 murein biosynthesis integral membrane protein MurJ [Gammaproteobacteria bacterium]